MSADLLSDPSTCVYFCLKQSEFASRERVKVSLSAKWNKKPHVTDPIIDQIWSERCSLNKTLWNGTKFRFQSATYESEGQIDICLGFTDYKEFLGTNCRKDGGALLEEGVKLFNDQHAFMSDALGVGTLLVTKDNQIVLMRRSEKCGEDQLKWDTPGGHPEPKCLMPQLDASSTDSDITADHLEQACVELFDSVTQEVVDEVGIERCQLSEPLLMGIDRNRVTFGRPTAQFYMKTSLCAEEVSVIYHEGKHLEAYESTALKFIPLLELEMILKSEIWVDHVAPSAKGCILIFLNGRCEFKNNQPVAYERF